MAVIVSKIVKRVVSYIIITLYARKVRLQRVYQDLMICRQTATSIKNEWTVWITLFTERRLVLATWRQRLHVLEAEIISSIWCKDDVT